MGEFVGRVRRFAYWRGVRLKKLAQRETYRLVDSLLCIGKNRRHDREGPHGVDPRIHYPCYRSLDEFVDVEHLRSLDAWLTERVVARMRAGAGSSFYTGGLKRGVLSRYRPGSTEIALSRTHLPRDYYSLNDPDLWEETPEVEEFAPLMEFIRTLPFARLGRMLILGDERGRAVTAHRDHDRTDVCHEFVWFRTNPRKRLWVEDVARTEQVEVEGHSAWFDTVNQYHGVRATGDLTISVRVDGAFTDEFRALQPVPRENAASRPALWACLERSPTPVPARAEDGGRPAPRA